MPADDRAGTGTPPTADDWAAHLTAKVEDVVSLVRDRTVVPVATAVRFVILGLLGAALGTLMVALFSVGVIRLLDTEAFHRRVWASYLVVGGIFFVAGLLVARMRRRRS